MWDPWHLRNLWPPRSVAGLALPYLTFLAVIQWSHVCFMQFSSHDSYSSSKPSESCFVHVSRCWLCHIRCWGFPFIICHNTTIVKISFTWDYRFFWRYNLLRVSAQSHREAIYTDNNLSNYWIEFNENTHILRCYGLLRHTWLIHSQHPVKTGIIFANSPELECGLVQ
jgi:hypothetical protein